MDSGPVQTDQALSHIAGTSSQMEDGWKDRGFLPEHSG